FPAVTAAVIRTLRPSAICTRVSGAIGDLTTATLSSELTTIAQLLIDTTCKKPSIDDQNLTGDKACGIGCEKYRSARQLIDPAKSFHRRSHQKFLAAGRVVQKVSVH